MTKVIFMMDSLGNGVSFPLSLEYTFLFLWYWSNGFNYTELWK